MSPLILQITNYQNMMNKNSKKTHDKFGKIISKIV
jgi:hypothetical protein